MFLLDTNVISELRKAGDGKADGAHADVVRDRRKRGGDAGRQS